MRKSPKIGLVSLGCAKNLVDAQRLTSVLIAMGYEIENEYSKCDAVIVNTCGFIGPAVEESMQAIGEALNYSRKVIVTGCLGARAKVILDKYPQVAAVYGPGMRATVIRGIISLVGTPDPSAAQSVNPSGILLTPPHYAYLKIAEGCRHHCSFCIIPSLRGPLRSRFSDAIYNEASDLVRRGVKELLVIAQDSSDYGMDLKKNKTSLSALLRQLSELKRWIRVHYVYPSDEADRVVDLMGEGLVLPYLDVPFQHVNPTILRSMKRPGNIEKTLRSIEKWRSVCPDIAIRSTFIAGFPGETEEQFNELLDFIKEAKLDRVGCFPYSDVDGATANTYLNPVDEQIREERAARLMELQAQISYDKLEARVGKEYQVLIDYVSDDGIAVGRSKYESPDIDGVISIPNAKDVQVGDLVKAVITSHDEHDMEATLAGKTTGSISFVKK
ncbi:ribosomal protein S12 methylthiotransferase [Succinivibrio dextrinosolvens]|uniref:30S ribosomal protein S12 methylthiotransferase RimO n=1 Tax=Succinivibrio dextrinosolvens TaxID=83771 RepID=UPI0008E3F3B0|nr:30S ribosomal protein S12 methylthiotransferase RimO [Succinivibrio dextrinosolvens]SFS45222.1 ribosomal protein S12 methylthiotransferase [Succinivibrio dextrinosolvens]